LFFNVDYSLVKDIYKHVTNCILCKFIFTFSVVITIIIIIQNQNILLTVLVKDQLSQCLLVCVGLFLYRSVHPFKCPVISNITLGLIFDGNDYNFSAAHITWTLYKIVTFFGIESEGNNTNSGHLNSYRK
jgi:hypothetical protein